MVFRRGIIPWNRGLTKFINYKVRRLGEKTSRTRKKLFAEGKLKSWNKGREVTLREREHLKKIGLKKGNIPWNKSKKGLQTAWNKGLTKESDEGVKRCAERQKGKHYSLRTEFKKGHIGYKSMLGKQHSEEAREKMSINKKGKHFSLETEFKKGRHYSLETEFTSKRLKEMWQDSNFRERTIKATLKAICKRPTSLEREFIEFIHKYNLPYKYIGDGSLLIGFKNPDFANTDGKKICIEVRARILCRPYEKQSPEKWAKKRIEHFRKYGWRCLIFFADRIKRQWIFETKSEQILELII